jgi:hypothetical protein
LVLRRFDLFVAFQSTVLADVSDRHAAFVQHAGDQPMAMADERILFAAHQRDANAWNPGLDSVQSREKKIGFGHTMIENVPGRVIVRIAAGPPAELVAEKQILDAAPGQKIGE